MGWGSCMPREAWRLPSPKTLQSVVWQQELYVVPYLSSHCGGEAPLLEDVFGRCVAAVLGFS